LDALGGQVLVRDEGRTWEPDTGQIHLELGGDAPIPATSRTLKGPTGASCGPPAPAVAVAVAMAVADEWYERGLELEKDSPDRAREAYRRALALEPGHADAHVNLGRLLHEEGLLGEAEGHYRAAAAAEPGNGRALYNLGVALEDQGRADAAVEAYETALSLDPELGVAHFNLSRLFEAAGRPEDALRHLASYKRILDRGRQGT
jgi:tetratricopeptide (TPR) repeat protein